MLDPGRFIALFLPAFLAGFLLATAPARAEELFALYRVSYAGLPAGEIRFAFTGDGALYRDEIVIESEGLARWVTHFRGRAVSEGRLGEDGSAAPLGYDALYDLHKRRNSRIAMRFVRRDGATIAERAATDTSRKPPLPDRDRRNVVDPVSALAAIRHVLLLHRPAVAGDFTLPVYDGARRFDVLVHVAPAQGSPGMIGVHLTLRPIAGFKGESSEDGDPDDAPRPVEAAFTDDANLLPYSMRVLIWHLPLAVIFERLCPSVDSCGAGAP